MSVRYVDSECVPLGDHTFMWVLVVNFACDPAADDTDVLGWIIDSPQYGYDFASPFEGNHSPRTPDLHGRWWRSAITVDRFRPCSADEAVEVIRAWANDQDWTDPNFVLSARTQSVLADVYQSLRVGRLYRLQNPPADEEHDYGQVMGTHGFHEFVRVGPDRTSATLIVACDD